MSELERMIRWRNAEWRAPQLQSIDIQGGRWVEDNQDRIIGGAVVLGLCGGLSVIASGFGAGIYIIVHLIWG